MKKLLTAIAILCIIFTQLTVIAANKTVYTFKGTNIVTDGSPNDITDAPLTNDITVTTSGDMNRKYAAVTDLKHNKDAGTFPANDSFKASGSYIYLACANANDNAIITLNLPEIKKGSLVTLTFAKPTVTNNGSTLRNTYDPYAYFKIADRYISINGDNFDAWRTQSVVTGEDTSAIEFHCDKWGAAAISKIEISQNNGTKLHSVSISSAQYANLTVNGIKFCADENGEITIPSFPEGEKITISAVKDGYKEAKKTLTIGKDDTRISIPLECELDTVYYESDFGNALGVLSLDGEYKLGNGIELKDVTRLLSRVTFKENGFIEVNTDSGEAVKITCSDGLYINGEKITQKDNMEFELFFDKINNIVFLCENDTYTKTASPISGYTSLISIKGQNADIEYIGVSYPNTTKMTIEGAEIISSHPEEQVSYYYEAKPEYYIPDTDIAFADVNESFARIRNRDDGSIGSKYTRTLVIEPGASGKVTLTAEYNGALAVKEIKIVNDAKLKNRENVSNTLNLHSSRKFTIANAYDEYGNELNYLLKDFRSSDESVITIDRNGIMTAVGNGTAVITANAYTGADNFISAELTSGQFYIAGIAEGDISYANADIIRDEHVISYNLSLSDGTKKPIEKTKIPAATVKEEGIALTAHYSSDKLLYIESQRVKSGDLIPLSNGTKRVYFCKNGKIEKITDADTSMEGFEINGKEDLMYYITPVYKFTDIGDVSDGKTLDALFVSGIYNITFKKAETGRGDIYVNGYMAGNNVDQSDADRKVTEGALYTAENIKVKDGKISVSMTDGSTLLDYVTVQLQPPLSWNYFTNTDISDDFYGGQRVFVIGDSLACSYYGDFEQEVGGGRTGWGQVLGDFLNISVTNLANSGQYAAGLYTTAFPSVIENGNTNDICLIECGYNDRNYSTREEMTFCVKDMIRQCREKGIIPILVTPNASEHDYKPSVAWSGYLKDIAADTGCMLIDLSLESYNFLYSLYGDNKDSVITKNYNLTEVGGDTLHSSYAAAYKWASIVASHMTDIFDRDITDHDFEYTFTDTLGNKITAAVK